GYDQQDGISACSPCLEHLERVEDKVLAQARNRYRSGGRFEVRQRALEEFLIGKNGQCSRSRPLVAFRQFCGIKITANKSFGRRSLLDFSNNGGTGAPDLS